MKWISMALLSLTLAAFAGEPQSQKDLTEFPEEFRGTFYLHKQIVERKIEPVSPAKAFGTIEAKQVVLAGGDTLKIKSIKQTAIPDRRMPAGSGKTLLTLVVSFEDQDFTWGISFVGSELGILQTVHKTEPKAMGETLFIVSREK